jgi:hypothetical protein
MWSFKNVHVLKHTLNTGGNIICKKKKTLTILATV